MDPVSSQKRGFGVGFGPLGFHGADAVAELGGLFVIFHVDSVLEFLLEADDGVVVGAAFADVLDEFLEHAEFDAVGGGIVLLFDFVEEFVNFGHAGEDAFDGFIDAAVGGEAFGLGAGVHHVDVGFELDEFPDEVLGFGVFFDEIEDFEAVAGIADDAFVVLEDHEAEVAVVELDAFLLEFGAGIAVEAGADAAVGDHFAPVEVEGGVVFVGAGAVGASVEFHLEDAEVEAELEFAGSVGFAVDEAGGDGGGVERPGVEKMGKIR